MKDLDNQSLENKDIDDTEVYFCEQDVDSIESFSNASKKNDVPRSLQGQQYLEFEVRNQIVQALPDLAWLKDLNGTYVTCNQNFLDFFNLQDPKSLAK